MAITAKWFNEEQTIILQTLLRGWEWEELLDFNRSELPTLLGSVNHTVDVIADMRSNVSLPFGSALKNGFEVVQFMPDNWGWTIIVTQDSLISTMVKLVGRFAIFDGKQKIFTVESIEKAVAMIGEPERI